MLNWLTPQIQAIPARRARDLLHEDRLDRRAAALAAELLVDADPEEAGLGHVVPELAREVRAVVILVPLELEGLVLRALGLDPVADRAAEVLFLVAEPEVHRGRLLGADSNERLIDDVRESMLPNRSATSARPGNDR